MKKRTAEEVKKSVIALLESVDVNSRVLRLRMRALDEEIKVLDMKINELKIEMLAKELKENGIQE